MKKVYLILFLLLGLIAANAQKIYFISALGADSSIYTHIKLESTYCIKYVEWLIPLKKESITHYCSRLIDENQISNNDIVIGTSFGGIIATEIGKLIHLKKLILISSISTSDEKPSRFKFLRIFRFNKLIPKSMLNNPKLIIKSCFGEVSVDERYFLSEMIKNYNVDLVYWSLNQIMKFNNRINPKNLVKINGSNDKTFPSKNIRTDYLIDGTHLMVYNNALEVSSLLNELLRENTIDNTKYLTINIERELLKPSE